MGHRPGAEVGCCPGQGLAPRLRPGPQVRNHLVVPTGGGTGGWDECPDHKQRPSPQAALQVSEGTPSTPAPPSSSRKEVKITLSPRSVPGPRTLIFHLGLLPWQPALGLWAQSTWACLGHLTTEQWPWTRQVFRICFEGNQIVIEAEKKSHQFSFFKITFYLLIIK